MAGKFGHVELQTKDLGKAKTFYQSLFDRVCKDIPEMSYALLNMDE